MKSSKSATPTKTSVLLRKMVVAVDLSDHSEATARYAAEIASCFSASLSVVYVYKPVPLGEYVCESTFTILEEERDRLCKLLGELAQKVKPSGLMCKAVFLAREESSHMAVEQISRRRNRRAGKPNEMMGPINARLDRLLN